jgi:hypothetical protein
MRLIVHKAQKKAIEKRWRSAAPLLHLRERKEPQKQGGKPVSLKP